MQYDERLLVLQVDEPGKLLELDQYGFYEGNPKDSQIPRDHGLVPQHQGAKLYGDNHPNQVELGFSHNLNFFGVKLRQTSQQFYRNLENYQDFLQEH